MVLFWFGQLACVVDLIDLMKNADQAEEEARYPSRRLRPCGRMLARKVMLRR